MNDLNNTFNYLAQTRYRYIWVHSCRAAFYLLSAMVAITLALFVIAQNTTSLRVIHDLLLAVWMCGTGAWLSHLRGLRHKLNTPRAVVDAIKNVYPAQYESLLSIVELTGQIEHGIANFSPALFDLQVNQTWGSLRKTPVRKLFPFRLIRPALLALLLALTAVYTALDQLPPSSQRVLAKLLYLFDSGSDRFDLPLAQEPLVGDLELLYIFPAFLQRASLRQTDGTGHINAPAGTQVRIEAQAFQSVSGIDLILSSSDAAADDQRSSRHAMTLISKTRYAAEFLITQDSSYFFEIRQINGAWLRDPIVYQIQIEPDALPTVALHAAPNGTVISSPQPLPLLWEAQDDHGLHDVYIVFRVADQDQHTSRLPTKSLIWQASPNDNTTKKIQRSNWNPPQTLKPSENLEYWLEAFDKNTARIPTTPGRTSTFRITLTNELARRNALETRLHTAITDGINILADRIEATPTSINSQLNAINKKQQKLSDDLNQIAHNMDNESFVSTHEHQFMNTLANRISAATQQELKQLQALSSPLQLWRQMLPTNLRPAHTDTNSQQIATLELSLFELDNLQRLLQLQTAAHLAKVTGETISNLLKSTRQISVIRQYSDGIQRQLSQLATYSPRNDLEHNAHQFKTALQQDNYKQLFAALTAIAEHLADLQITQRQQIDDQQLATFGEIEKMRRTELQLISGIVKQQQSLKQQTTTILEQHLANATHLDSSTVKLEKDLIENHLISLKTAIAQAQQTDWILAHRQHYDGLMRQLTRARDALSQRDYFQGAQAISGLRADLNDLLDDAKAEHDESENDTNDKLGHVVDKLTDANTTAKKIAATLKSIQKQAPSMHTKRIKQQATQLRRKQQLLQKTLKKSAQPRAIAAMHMSTAAEHLAQLQFADAITEQQEAILALSRSQSSADGEGREMPQSGSKHANVKIPRPEDFQPTIVLRQKLIQAMREEALDGYQQAVKKYYDALIR